MPCNRLQPQAQRLCTGLDGHCRRGQEESFGGGVLRDRLGRGPSRHRAGRPGRHPAGQTADRRRRGRVRRAAAAAGRGRRRPGRADPGGDRDQPRPVGGRPARHRTPGVPDQPDVGVAVSGPALGRAAQVRRRGRAGAGQHSAHRPGRAPTAARGLRTGAGDRGARPRPTGCGLGAHRRAQQAALVAARVLPRHPARRSPASAAGCCAPKPGPCWPPPPPRAPRPG